MARSFAQGSLARRPPQGPAQLRPHGTLIVSRPRLYTHMCTMAARAAIGAHILESRTPLRRKGELAQIAEISRVSPRCSTVQRWVHGVASEPQRCRKSYETLPLIIRRAAQKTRRASSA
jgi:hypothetical protein